MMSVVCVIASIIIPSILSQSIHDMSTTLSSYSSTAFVWDHDLSSTSHSPFSGTATIIVLSYFLFGIIFSIINKCRSLYNMPSFNGYYIWAFMITTADILSNIFVSYHLSTDTNKIYLPILSASIIMVQLISLIIAGYHKSLRLLTSALSSSEKTSKRYILVVSGSIEAAQVNTKIDSFHLFLHPCCIVNICSYQSRYPHSDLSLQNIT